MVSSSTDLFRIFIMIKRREGLSREAFRDYYETSHVRFALDSAASSSLRGYTRHYLSPIGGGDDAAGDYDVVTECVFGERRIFDALVASLSRGEVGDDVKADEARFMDRARTRFYTVVECRSEL